MVRYYGDDMDSYSLLFWIKIPVNIKSIEDMRDKIVCVEQYSSQESDLNNYPFIIKKSTEKVDDALLNVQYGKCGAALVEPAIAKKFKNKFPEIQIIEVPLLEKDQVHGIGIAIKKTNKNLTVEIEKAVEVLK